MTLRSLANLLASFSLVVACAGCGIKPIGAGIRPIGSGIRPIFSGPDSRNSAAAVTASTTAPAADAMTIAVADLSAEGTAPSDAAVVAEILRSDLVKTGAFRVVEKQNMDKLLAEQAFQQTGCTDAECAVKLGKYLNVRRLAVGSFGKLMGKYFLNVRIVNVESGEIVFSDTAKGETADEVEAGIRGVAERAARDARVAK